MAKHHLAQGAFGDLNTDLITRYGTWEQFATETISEAVEEQTQRDSKAKGTLTVVGNGWGPPSVDYS